MNSEASFSNRKSPRLSIITICFNNAEGLKETLRSTLCGQGDFLDFEQIVVDGGSSDTTIDIIRKNESRISWWCSEPDKGIYNAMNKGVEHANGEYLLFLNSGDILLDNSLAKLFSHDFNEDLVYSDIYTDYANKYTLVKSPTDEELTPAYLTINTLPHQATLIRRDLHNRLGGYDETMKISAAPKFMMDALIGLKCSHRYIEMAYSHFDHSGISSNIKFLDTKLKEWQYFMRPHFGDRVADSFYRAKISEKLVSRDVIRYVSDHPEKIPSIWQALNDVVKNVKRNKYKPQEQMESEMAQVRIDCEKSKSGISSQLVLVNRQRAKLGVEVLSLKNSFAYRVGMFVTWPIRYLYRTILGR